MTLLPIQEISRKELLLINLSTIRSDELPTKQHTLKSKPIQTNPNLPFATMYIGSHGCYVGEDSDFEYTLTVCIPERKPPSWAPDCWSRLPTLKRNAALPYMIPRDEEKPNFPKYNGFEEKHLLGMKKKEVKISQWDLSVLCKHLKPGVYECKEACYVLEEGGKTSDWFCGRNDGKGQNDCQGHVYCGSVVRDAEYDSACFGKKGKRMVCINSDFYIRNE